MDRFLPELHSEIALIEPSKCKLTRLLARKISNPKLLNKMVITTNLVKFNHLLEVVKENDQTQSPSDEQETNEW